MGGGWTSGSDVSKMLNHFSVTGDVMVHAEHDAPGGRGVSSKTRETLEQFGEFIGAKDLVFPAHVPIAGGVNFTRLTRNN